MSLGQAYLLTANLNAFIDMNHGLQGLEKCGSYLPKTMLPWLNI
jgi:hypothetical protein